MQTHLEWLRAKIKEYEEFRDSNKICTNQFGIEYPDTWKEQDSWYASEKEAFVSLNDVFIAWLIKDYE